MATITFLSLELIPVFVFFSCLILFGFFSMNRQDLISLILFLKLNTFYYFCFTAKLQSSISFIIFIVVYTNEKLLNLRLISHVCILVVWNFQKKVSFLTGRLRAAHFHHITTLPNPLLHIFKSWTLHSLFSKCLTLTHGFCLLLTVNVTKPAHKNFQDWCTLPQDMVWLWPFDCTDILLNCLVTRRTFSPDSEQLKNQKNLFWGSIFPKFVCFSLIFSSSMLSLNK